MNTFAAWEGDIPDKVAMATLLGGMGDCRAISKRELPSICCPANSFTTKDTSRLFLANSSRRSILPSSNSGLMVMFLDAK